MSEFVYAVRIAPSGWIKVGRTARLGSRMMAHSSAAQFGGAGVDRVFSIACGASEAAEDAILKTVTALPGARVVHGKETFEGVSFAVVAAILDDVANRLLDGSLSPEAPPDRPVPELLLLIHEHVTHLKDHERMPSRVLRDRLAPEMTETAFGLQLRKWGCPTGRAPSQPKGPLVGDIRKAVRRIRLGGPERVAA